MDIRYILNNYYHYVYGRTHDTNYTKRRLRQFESVLRDTPYWRSFFGLNPNLMDTLFIILNTNNPKSMLGKMQPVTMFRHLHEHYATDFALTYPKQCKSGVYTRVVEFVAMRTIGVSLAWNEIYTFLQDKEFHVEYPYVLACIEHSRDNGMFSKRSYSLADDMSDTATCIHPEIHEYLVARYLLRTTEAKDRSTANVNRMLGINSSVRVVPMISKILDYEW